LRNRLLKFF